MKSQHDYMMEFKQWCKDNPERRITFYAWMILQGYAKHAEKSTVVKVFSYSAPAEMDNE